MKETIALENARFVANLPVHARASLSDMVHRLAARSMIIWGKHCGECAAPACYSACSFYSARADGHCRRFVNGIETVMDPKVPAGAVARVVFRRWGKLHRSVKGNFEGSDIVTIKLSLAASQQMESAG